MMLKCTGCGRDALEGELQGRGCPECSGTCVPVSEEQMVSYLIAGEQLPPFKCRIGSFGVPEVLVGFEASDGGRWSMRHRAAEEEVRKLLQVATDGASEVDEVGEYGGLEEFEHKVHFLLSHAVHMGWYIHVQRSVLDELGLLDKSRKLGVERRFAVSSSDAPERISKLVCPMCDSDAISMLEVKEVLTKWRAYLVNGLISVTRLTEGPTDDTDTKSIRFECLVCHEQWEAPPWIEQIIED